MAILWFAGILPSFYQWAINFGIFVLPRAEGQIQLPDLKMLLVSLLPFAIFIPIVLQKNKKSLSLLLWSIAGMLGAYPRFEYFHFQPAVAFLAIATGIVLSSDWKKDKLIKIFIPLYLIGSLYLFGGFFMRNWQEGTRFYEQDVQDIASYVKANTRPGDKIFVMNWWDNIYALTDTLPAVNPWVPQLSWYMEEPGIQDKMVKDLSENKPKIILLNPYSETGLSGYIPKKVFDYINSFYKLKEKVDGVEILIPNK